jgi:hypothetical protein
VKLTRIVISSLVGCIGYISLSSLFAQNIQNSQMQRSQVGTSAPTNTTKNNIQVDSETLEMSKYWGLTIDEYQRYKQLMKGLAGKMAVSGVTPLEVLGMYANTPGEREKYARMTAKMMRDYNQRALDFEYAYQKAYKDMYPNDKIINIDTSKIKLQERSNSLSNSSNGAGAISQFGISLRNR